MSALMHDVAGAAWPVAAGLVLLAAAARAARSAPDAHERARRLARQYLEPLCAWALVAAGVDFLAALAAGDAGAARLALPLGLGAVAAMLWASVEPSPVERPAEPVPARVAAAPAPTATAPPAPAPAAASSLWAEPVEDESARTGLWSRT
jgi:hypothetical protein